MTKPQKISGPELALTPEAIQAKSYGLVIVRCVITLEGAVSHCRVLKSLPHMEDAALAMLAQSRYTPAAFQGKPVAVDYTFVLWAKPPRQPEQVRGTQDPAKHQAEVDEIETGAMDVIIGATARGNSVESETVKVIHGTGHKGKIHCGPSTSVVINGTQLELTLTGECKEVRITEDGVGNKVQVEAFAALKIKGTDNVVTWKRWVGDGKPPTVFGGRNTVSQEK